MTGNEISVKDLRSDAVEWLTKLHQAMQIKPYGKESVRNYCQEMRLLFKYYNHKAVADIQQADVEQYMQYIKEVHKIGQAKCRYVAQACSFFLNVSCPHHTLYHPISIPKTIYPPQHYDGRRGGSSLCCAAKCKGVLCNRITLWLRAAYWRSVPAASARYREQQSTAKSFQGKGAKDRYTLLPAKLLEQLRLLYVQEGRPKEFGLLFEAAQHTITTLARDKKYMGATPGIVSILYTHGQYLNFHPHTHNIVSGGGMDGTGKWIKEKRANGRFLFPPGSMKKIYKGYFLAALRKDKANGTLQYTNRQAVENILATAGQKKWNVHANAV